ncbi:MAG: hypothetical protein AAGB19_01155 [Cyanobacteria bacterium P01_F01_bin.3]
MSQTQTFTQWYKTAPRLMQSAVGLTGLVVLGLLVILMMNAFRGPQMREGDIVELPQPERNEAPPAPVSPQSELCSVEVIATEELSDFKEAAQANRQILTRLMLQTSQVRTGNWREYASNQSAETNDTVSAWLLQRYAQRFKELEELAVEGTVRVDNPDTARAAYELSRELLELTDATEAQLSNDAAPQIDFVPVGPLLSQLEATHTEGSDLSNQRTFALRVQEALHDRGCITDETDKRL